jgi:hypothetical protein
VKPVTRTYTTAAAQDPIALDFEPTSQITVVVTVAAGGTLTTPLAQVTLDNVFDLDAADYVAPANARWVSITGLTVPTTPGAAYLTFDGPWRAVRLNTTAGITGSTIFQVGQSTTPRA